MSTKEQVIEDAMSGRGCLGRARDDEPVFVLRAHDKLAPIQVMQWADMAASEGAPAEKVSEARMVAVSMLAWQAANGAEVPD